MDEQAILTLISHGVRQILRENGARWNEDDECRISEHIADVAWTALIVGAREALARGNPVVLEEFGRFEVVDGSWRFDAAESLQEAKSLSLSSTAGNQFIAGQALYFLSRATELARRIPADTVLEESAGQTPEERLVNSIFPGRDSDLFTETFHARAQQLVDRLASEANQFRSLGATRNSAASSSLSLQSFPVRDALRISQEALRTTTMKISPEKIRDVIGKGGSVIRNIHEETGAFINIQDDGIIIITGDSHQAQAAGEWIEGILRGRVEEADKGGARSATKADTDEVQEQKPDLSAT